MIIEMRPMTNMINNKNPLKQWFAVHTKPSRETLAEENLKRQGYEVYYPRIKQECRRRSRWTSIIGPLFPRYLFVNLEQGRDNFVPIRSTYGVSDLVRFGGIPKTVSNALIEAIRAREDRAQGMHITHRNWIPGMEVVVAEGPFAGLKGIFKAESAEERVIILLRLLGRENRVVVTQNAIVPA